MLKPSDRRKKIINKNKTKKQWITASAIISFILVLIGAATLVLIQKPIQESQDLRQQASVDNGDVVMNFNPGDGSTLNVSEEAQVNYQVTTNGVQVDGFQMVFNVVTNTLGTAPEFVLTDTANLQIAYQQAQQVTDGYLVSVILIGDQIASPVSYASPSTIGHLRFTPQSTGTIEINFDTQSSISTVFNSAPPEDQLTHIPTLNYTVIDPTASPSPSPSASPDASPDVSPSPSAATSPSPTPSASPDASASPAVSPSPTPTVSPTPGVTPSPTATASPSPTPSADPGDGVGGTVSCNQSCSDNNDCEANHRCYNNQCRLVTNVSSSTCEQPSDNGIARSCNEYCADDRECGSGYSCYYNRCRNPLNLDNTACAQPSQQVVNAIFASCNQACATHNDCAANLFCHSTSGTCRLVTNPSSTSCTPASTSTVSNYYSGNTKGGTKGGYTGSTGSETGSTTGSTASPKVSSSPVASVAPITTGATGQQDETDLPIKDETALQALGSYFQDKLEERNISLPLFFIIIGILLLIIVFIISMLTRMFGKGSNQPPIITPVGRDRDKKKDAQYENKLAQKINSLQQNQSAPMAKPLPTSNAARPGVPSPVAPPPQAATTQPGQPKPMSPAPGQTQTAPKPGSSMMDRLKDKGINTPNN